MRSRLGLSWWSQHLARTSNGAMQFRLSANVFSAKSIHFAKGESCRTSLLCHEHCATALYHARRLVSITIDEALYIYLRLFFFFLPLLLGRPAGFEPSCDCDVEPAVAPELRAAGATTPVAPSVTSSLALASRSCLMAARRSASIRPSLGWLCLPPA
jgi:hypothetical protein